MCKSINIELSGGKMNYFDTFDWSTFSLRKKGINQADQNNSFHQNTNFLFKTKKPINGFFSKLCLHYIYLN